MLSFFANYKLLFCLPIFAMLSCGTNKGNNNSEAAKTKKEYAFITKIEEEQDSVFLTVDYVQYLTGDSATKAAVEAWTADTFQIDGVTHVDVPNDYYILNKSQKLRRLMLVDKCKIDFLLEIDRIDITVDNSLSSLMKIYKDNLFILEIDSNDRIRSIHEVFRP